MIFATLIIILQNQMIFFQFIFEILLMVPERFYNGYTMVWILAMLIESIAIY